MAWPLSQDYNEAIRLNPSDAEAYNGRGNASSAKKYNDRAIQDYDEAIRLKPNFSGAYYNRALAYADALSAVLGAGRRLEQPFTKTRRASSDAGPSSFACP